MSITPRSQLKSKTRQTDRKPDKQTGNGQIDRKPDRQTGQHWSYWKQTPVVKVEAFIVFNSDHFSIVSGGNAHCARHV